MKTVYVLVNQGSVEVLPEYHLCWNHLALLTHSGTVESEYLGGGLQNQWFFRTTR